MQYSGSVAMNMENMAFPLHILLAFLFRNFYESLDALEPS